MINCVTISDIKFKFNFHFWLHVGKLNEIKRTLFWGIENNQLIDKSINLRMSIFFHFNQNYYVTCNKHISSVDDLITAMDKDWSVHRAHREVNQLEIVI